MNKTVKPKSPPSVSIIRKATSRSNTRTKEKELNRMGGKLTPPSNLKNTKAAKEMQSFNIDSNDVSIDQDMEDQMIIQETSAVKLELLQSLQAFRTANKEMFKQNLELKQEVDEFSKDFVSVKTEVAGLLRESYNTKNGMKKIKQVITNTEAVLNLDLSSVRDCDEEVLMKTLRELQEKVEILRGQISSNEEEIRSRESLNSEMKNSVYRIRDRIMTTPVLMNESKQPKCCRII